MPADETRWQAHIGSTTARTKLVFYCPECTEREFGESPPGHAT